jgi:tyrosine-protein kinase Etk/Wzc
VEQDVLRLTRDVRVNTEVYTAGLSTAQQLRLVTASKVGNARLLDTPMPPTAPIKPRRMLVILIVGMIGLVLGVIGAYIRKVFYGRIDDPQEIKQLFGVPLSATIPHSQGQEQLYAQIQSKSRAVSVLASSAPGDSAVESLRGFRASLQFSMRDSSNNIIVITSPTPEVGKSFVAANFATVLAAVGKKILLIDGDLRKGHLHRYFGLDRKKGLAEAILAPGIFEQIIQRNVVENVDFISTGNLPKKPAELLGHQNFGTLLRLLSGRYDYVLVDTAPVLAVADALTVGPYAGAMFNVVRGGVTTANEIEETVKRLNQAGATVTGTVFNDLRPRHARYGYGSLYEGYGYAGQA